MSDKNELVSAAKADFRIFMKLVWRHLNLPDPDPVQLDIASYLQHGPNRKVIMAYRGVGKSWATAAYVVWSLWRDKERKFLVVSATDQFAQNWVRFAKSIIEGMPICAHMVPEGDQYRWSAFQFDIMGVKANPAPSVRAASITGQITGSRADEIICDDVEIPRTCATQVQREKLGELVKEFDSIITPKKSSSITYLGTPHTEDSLYVRLSSRGYSVRVWPVRFPKDVEKYGVTLAPKIREAMAEQPEIVGEPTEPRRFSELFLQDKELSIGRSTFALQFMLDTRLSDLEKYPLKVADLIVTGLDPTMCPEKIAWANDPRYVIEGLPNLAMLGDRFHGPMGTSGELVDYQGSVMVIDPSGRGADETAYAVAKIRNSQIFVHEVAGLQGGYDEVVLKKLVEVAKRHKVNHIVIEANFGDGMFEKLLQPYLRKYYACTTEEVKAPNTMFKEARIIDILEPVMNQHRLVLDPSVIKSDYETIQKYPPEQQRQYSLIFQMTRITREKGALLHDDRLDALAWAVWYWTTSMGQDVETQMHEEQTRRILKDIEEMEAGLRPEFSSCAEPPMKPNWICR